MAPPLSQISGVKKPLGHTNSFSGNTLPEYGVETKHPEKLAKVSATNGEGDGQDIFF